MKSTQRCSIIRRHEKMLIEQSKRDIQQHRSKEVILSCRNTLFAYRDNKRTLYMLNTLDKMHAHKRHRARRILFFRERKVSFISAHASERVSISEITSRVLPRNFFRRRNPAGEKKEPIPRNLLSLSLFLSLFLVRLVKSRASSFPS